MPLVAMLIEHKVLALNVTQIHHQIAIELCKLTHREVCD